MASTTTTTTMGLDFPQEEMELRSSSTEKFTAPRNKVHYADNLRSSLTALVVFHHAAMNFGGVGISNYYGRAPLSSPALVGFNVVNQTFFMGAFMFLGGHFSKRASRRKTESQFIKDRLYRLGLPSLAYTLYGAPTTVAIFRAWKGQDVGWAFWLQHWKSVRSLMGPVWFTGLLLCFDLLLIAWKRMKRVMKIEPGETTEERSKKVRGLAICAALAITSACNFLARTVWPVGAHTRPLGIQPAYLAHYLASYIFGTYVGDLDDAVPSRKAMLGLGVGSVISSYAFARALKMSGNIKQMLGGYSTAAASYANLNNVLGFFLGTLVLRTFKRHFNRSWGSINDASYTAFLIHMPILTAITIGAQRWNAGPLVKTAGVGGATVVVSWLAASVVNEALARADKFLSRTASRKE